MLGTQESDSCSKWINRKREIKIGYEIKRKRINDNSSEKWDESIREKSIVKVNIKTKSPRWDLERLPQPSIGAWSCKTKLFASLVVI